MPKEQHQKEIWMLLEVLPDPLKEKLKNYHDISGLIEIILDIGKLPQARFSNNDSLYVSDQIIEQKDLDFVTEKIGQFTTDNRAIFSVTKSKSFCSIIW